MGRISIAGLLGLVVAIALGLAAVVNANEFWAWATLLLTLTVLFGSVIGTILRGWRTGGWLGFAVFGWGYLLLLFVPGLGDHVRSLSDPMANWVFEKANPEKVPEVPVPSPSGSPFERSPFESPATSTPPASATPVANSGVVAPPITPLDPAYNYYYFYLPRHSERSDRARVIGTRLATLTFAVVGAVVGALLSRRRPSAAEAAPVA
jgi:hypothetical protein